MQNKIFIHLGLGPLFSVTELGLELVAEKKTRTWTKTSLFVQTFVTTASFQKTNDMDLSLAVI